MFTYIVYSSKSIYIFILCEASLHLFRKAFKILLLGVFVLFNAAKLSITRYMFNKSNNIYKELLSPVSKESGKPGSMTSVLSSGGEILPGYYIPDLILCRVYTGFEQGH